MNWSKINPDQLSPDSTIWHQIDDSNSGINLGEIEEAFRQQEKRSKEEESSSSSSSASASASSIVIPKTPKITSILDPKKSQNLSIVLSRFRGLTLNQIASAIVNVDLSIINPDSVSTLISVLPDQMEIDKVASYDGDRTLLAKPDQFVLAVSGIPRLRERLSCFEMSHTFIPRQKALLARIGFVISALKELRCSEKLKLFLQMSLAAGNFLNCGTARGNASAFSIRSLPQVKPLFS